MPCLVGGPRHLHLNNLGRTSRTPKHQDEQKERKRKKRKKKKRDLKKKSPKKKKEKKNAPKKLTLQKIKQKLAQNFKKLLHLTLLWFRKGGKK